MPEMQAVSGFKGHITLYLSHPISKLSKLGFGGSNGILPNGTSHIDLIVLFGLACHEKK